MRSVARYFLCGEIASGGMASVHFARLVGPAGFSRTVAVKRLHPHLARNPDFSRMFLDEARLAARIRHPNVVSAVDVVANDGELFLVMEYVPGEALSRLVRECVNRATPVPPPVAVTVISDVLDGLHAAHTTSDANGLPLAVVHRDISPQNILVGVEGLARILDFGIAKALGRLQETEGQQFKGKLGYMPPEQIDGRVSQRSDLYAVSVVLWEMLAGRRLFDGDDRGAIVGQIHRGVSVRPSAFASGVSRELDDFVMKGLARDEADRFRTAEAMAIALRSVATPARRSDVAKWVELVAGDALETRAGQVRAIEAEAIADAAETDPPAPQGRPSGEFTGSIDLAFDTGAATPPEEKRKASNSATAPRPARSTPSSRLVTRAVAIVAMMAIVAALGVALLVVRRPLSPVAKAAATSSPGEPAVATSKAAATAFFASSDTSEARAPQASGPAPSALPGPTRAPAPVRAASTKRPSAPRPPSQSCNPPYREVVVGSNLRRIPKPECE